jgi:hypothetical protein
MVYVTLLSSMICLIMPWLSVATAGQIRLFITAPIALAAFVLAIATTLFAVVLYRTRGLWVALGAVPALFWPVALVSFLTACSIYGCDWVRFETFFDAQQWS